MTLSELAALHPTTPWCEYINRLVCKPGNICVLDNDRIMINSPSYLSALNAMVQTYSKRVQANYVVWRAVESCVSFSDSKLRERQQSFHKDLYGRPAREPRRLECSDLVSNSLYLAVSSMYVQQYFDENAKDAAVEIAENIRKEMYDTLANSGMMSVTSGSGIHFL